MIRALFAQVFDFEGRLWTGVGTVGATVSWSLSQVGSVVIMLLTILILGIKAYKSVRDIKRPDKEN
jgi:hypothetical protein